MSSAYDAGLQKNWLKWEGIVFSAAAKPTNADRPKLLISAPGILISKRSQVIENGKLSRVTCPPLGIAAIQVIFYLQIRSSLYEQLHHGKMPVLRRHVQRRHALAMSEAAECSFLIDRRTVVDQPFIFFRAVAHRSPDEGCSAIGIGIEARTGASESGKHIRSTGFRSPDKRLI